MLEKKELDMSLPAPASSVVMKAIDAKTFTEMEGFVKDLESRSIDRLLKDLPNLASLPSAKVSLVSYVITGKYRQADPESRAAIKRSVEATVSKLDIDEQRDRITQILERLR